MDPAQTLVTGLRDLGLALPRSVQAGLLEFVDLLVRWNRVYNLTAVRNGGEMVRRHILDSLIILPFLEGERIIDVGSGPGLPGIPLALVKPEYSFVLLDSSAKKTRFLRHAVVQLNVRNVSVVRCRVEDYVPEQRFDTVVARAFAAIPVLLARTRHLCREGGVVLAMKGKRPDAEIVELPEGFTLADVQPLKVPGVGAPRHLVRLRYSH
jgi:16S rRNA (guanine527-N7)-methyltransferase